jgi:Na+/H+ antiporter NhaD/arsenite permease-like protein
METVEHFSDFLRKIGVPNFLAIGIVLIVLWLLISGIRKGLKKGKHGQESADENDRED